MLGPRRGAGPLLEVRELSVVFSGRSEETVIAVDGVSFTVEPGQTVGLVGESGCGKSVTGLAIAGLLSARGNRVGGQVVFAGRDLLALRAKERRDLRGREIGMIFQDPFAALNPVLPIGLQVAEVLQRHRGCDRRGSMRSARELLDSVGIADPDRRLREYPHQMSGGMRQRALIAMALAGQPKLLIADEPTTALDVTVQAQILDLLRRVVEQTGTALLVITHDLGVVAGLCDEVHVLYAGKLVESAERHRLFATPRHPYTHGLLGAVPRLDSPRGQPLSQIRGSIADAPGWAQGCAFAPRCDRVVDACLTGTPPLSTGAGQALRCNNPMPVEVPG